MPNLNIPKDPVMLLSFVNTQLRDHYHSLESFCKAYMVESDALIQTLDAIDYAYDTNRNQFI